MRIHVQLLAVAAVTLAAPAATAGSSDDPAAELRKTLAGRVAGKPVACISLPDVTGSTIVTGRANVYRIGARLFVNEPSGGAARLHRDDVLVTRTSGSNLCRSDIVRVLDRSSTIPHGFVSLGLFVPYAKPETG